MPVDLIPFEAPVHDDPTSMTTFTGRTFSLVEPRSEDVDIVDIAVSLSRLPRFNGHTRPIESYSVAQHSTLASIYCPQCPLVALLHDAAEAYTGDITKPMKIAIGDRFKEIEQKIHMAIATRFCIPSYMPKEVKRVDDWLLRTEQRDLMGRKVRAGEETFDDLIVPVDRYQAMCEFLYRFEDLTECTVNWTAVPPPKNLEET
jgi:hypothetical protein